MKIQREYREAVDEFVNRALQKYGADIDSIILFGSVARGEAKEDYGIALEHFMFGALGNSTIFEGYFSYVGW
jgi:hypothetical protein